MLCSRFLRSCERSDNLSGNKVIPAPLLVRAAAHTTKLKSSKAAQAWTELEDGARAALAAAAVLVPQVEAAAVREAETATEAEAAARCAVSAAASRAPSEGPSTFCNCTALCPRSFILVHNAVSPLRGQ